MKNKTLNVIVSYAYSGLRDHHKLPITVNVRLMVGFTSVEGVIEAITAYHKTGYDDPNDFPPILVASIIDSLSGALLYTNENNYIRPRHWPLEGE